MTAIPAIGLVSATSAQAQNDERASCANSKIHLDDDWGCVISYGDHIRVSDQTWDGNGTRVNWRSSNGREGHCTDYNGSENGYEDCNYNFPEGTGITYRLEQINDGKVVDYTAWHYVEV